VVRKRLTARARERRTPKRPESPGEHGPRFELILRRAWGTAFSGGISRWSAGTRPGRVSYESARAERSIRKNLPIPEKEKSSEGRSPGALGVERHSQGPGTAQTAERVAKPCGRHFRGPRQRSPDAFRKEGAKRGSRVRKCCRAIGTQARCSITVAGVDPAER
jgi:hypothetical protein